MQLPRASGLLLHPTSLPGRFGIGDLGPEAHAFLDFLAETGQTWWQMLPLGPIGYGESPYQSHSSFAGNPLLISLDRLVDRGWLDARELAAVPDLPDGRVDFDAVAAAQVGVAAPGVPGVRRVAGTIRTSRRSCRRTAWLDDYVFFRPSRTPTAASPGTSGSRSWSRASRRRCDRWRRQVAEGIRFHEFVQYAFESQWQELRRRRRRPGGSSSSATCRSSWRTTAPTSGRIPTCSTSTSTAGRSSWPACRPTTSARTGSSGATRSIAGRPTRRTATPGGCARLRALLERVDLIRIDHFRGFEAYWEVPAGSETAATGEWVRAPGRPFFKAVREELGAVPADRRGPGRDHARGRGAARRVRPARHADPPVRLRRRPEHGEVPAAPLRQQLRRLHRDARQRHDLRLVPSKERDDHAAPRGGRGGAPRSPRSTPVPTGERSTGT